MGAVHQALDAGLAAPEQVLILEIAPERAHERVMAALLLADSCKGLQHFRHDLVVALRVVHHLRAAAGIPEIAVVRRDLLFHARELRVLEGHAVIVPRLLKQRDVPVIFFRKIPPEGSLHGGAVIQAALALVVVAVIAELIRVREEEVADDRIRKVAAAHLAHDGAQQAAHFPFPVFRREGVARRVGVLQAHALRRAPAARGAVVERQHVAWVL